MSNKIWDEVRTGLWLNGPTLSITSNPSDTTVCAGSNATFSVSAQASFPSGAGSSAAGTLVYVVYFEVLEKERVKKRDLDSKTQSWCQLYGIIQVSNYI